MTKSHVLRPLARANAFVAAAVMATSVLLPAVLLSGSADAAQLANRFIDMSATQTSEGSGRDGGDAFGQDVTYSVSFDLNQAHGNLEGIVVDFCSNSPILGDACTAPTGFDINEGTLAIANLVGATSLTLDAASDANTVILTDATGDNLAGAATVSFDLGDTGAGDGLTNPTTVGTFYARIATYTDSTVAAAYASATPGANTDDGGIALAVANELTVSARVQEVLEFCIGTETDSSITPATGEDCSDVAGTDLDLGVVDSNSINTTAANDGLAMIRTNALNGAVVYYKAEQEAGITNGAGRLRQATVECNASPTNLADACFNSVGTTRSAITAGVENFGVALKERITTTGGATNVLRCDAEYAGDGATTCTGTVAGNNYAWDDSGAFDTLASSTGPIDDELVRLEFAATASPTTPTGLYTVTANFVATSTF